MKKIMVIGLVIGVSIVAWYKLSLRPADPSNDVRQSVKIEQGLSVAGIGTLLEEKGIIRSARAFSLYARFHGAQTSLQAGDYLLYPSQSVSEIIDALRSGKSEEITVTIPEGYTVEDIDRLLASKNLLSERSFVPCALSEKVCDLSAFTFLPQRKSGVSLPPGGLLEGYLFPDTYLVLRDGFDPLTFAERLLKNFQKRVVVGLSEDFKASKYSLHDIITMASLIEEETRSDDERAIVSGILWKRFNKKMGLDVDAAVRYAVNKPTAPLTKADLDTDSPYNLRKYRGLPPGPIANPGLKSIQAALHPEDSKYWYYLHGKDGMIRYAETNEQHNQNKALYLN